MVTTIVRGSPKQLLIDPFAVTTYVTSRGVDVVFLKTSFARKAAPTLFATAGAVTTTREASGVLLMML